MMSDSEGGAETVAWLICNGSTIRKYGLGHAKPAPVPTSIYVRNKYLVRGGTLAELAAARSRWMAASHEPS